MNPLRRFAPWAMLGALTAASVGCSSTSSCNRDDDAIDVYGFVNADRTVFTSLQPDRLEDGDGGMLPGPAIDAPPLFEHFPANRTITFHVGLVGDPINYGIYLSFSPEGNNTVAPAAGNQSLIKRHNKDEVALRNDTCTEFWVWFTASTSATPFHRVSDSGVDDGTATTGGTAGTEPSDAAGAPGVP